MTLTTPHPWIERIRAVFETEGGRSVAAYVQRQRWFGGKGRSVGHVRLVDAIELSVEPPLRLLAIVRVDYHGGVYEWYTMPLSIKPKAPLEEAGAIIEVSDPSGPHWVCDATQEEEVWRVLQEVATTGRELVGQSGSVVGKTMAGRQEELAGPVTAVKVLSAEQSNTSVVFDRRVIMKLIRKVELGVNPDSEVLEFLTTQTTCENIPPLLGLLTYNRGQAEEAAAGTIGVIQRFVPNRGDGWTYTLRRLDDVVQHIGATLQERGGDPLNVFNDISPAFLEEIHYLGAITGQLHRALASKEEPDAFRPEPITSQDVERWQGRMQLLLAEVCRDLRSLSTEQRARVELSLDDVDGLEAACQHRFTDLSLLAEERTAKIRHHGDFHLGQVLKTDDGFVVIDFEGEPARPFDERRAKVCPLKDVAGMLRSLSYVAQAVLKQRRPASATDSAVVALWEQAARIAFLEGYRTVVRPGETAFVPKTWADTRRVLDVYELDKSVYELRYELRNRPDWLAIPLQGLRCLVHEQST